MKSLALILGLTALISCTIPNPEQDDLLLAPSSPIGDDSMITYYQTNGDASKLFEQGQKELSTKASGIKILIDPSQKYQQMVGFGAAMTDSSAYLIWNHPQKDQIMKALFDPNLGAGISFLRVTLGSSDFSRNWYTYADTPNDEDLSEFSISMEKSYLIPLLLEAKEINPNLQFMGTPWTAPGWMKFNTTPSDSEIFDGNSNRQVDTKNMVGGWLKNELYPLYAEYLVKTIKAFAAEGIDFHSITLQNEPAHPWAAYPCMGMSPQDQANLIKELKPLMELAQLTTEVLVWDHNFIEGEYENGNFYPSLVWDNLTSEERSFVSGSAWHAYMGTPEEMSKAKEDVPQWDIYFTEMTGGEWATNFGNNLSWDIENVFVGAPRNWAKTVLKWNLALDQYGGPNIRGDNNIMRAVLTLNDQTGRVDKEEDYYLLAHTARFIHPGAYRIHSTYNGDIQNVAYQNPDGEIVILVGNTSSFSRSFTLTVGSHHFLHTLPPKSIATVVM